ncbi:GntR family transcriptional regulator [Nocardia brevicatena]|uniref:GntR family transcriptional regulator n=1 Tax=Nocardia brevicatena TaxID=37327 RepID=UPI0002FD8075|nr:GntR family transcriptional regulator [Nocardia brevicatena]
MTTAIGGGTRRGNAVEDTYLVLRERIVDGTYRPGTALSQVQLAAELAVSRTPLREALRRLEAEDLVVGQANRGVVVAPLELGDVEDSYAIRLLVEPALLSAVLDRVTAGDIDAMAAALGRMRRHRNSPRDFQRAHWEYHRVMLGRCPAATGELIESQLTKIDRHQRLYFSHPVVVEDVTGTDQLFLDAVVARDAESVRHILGFHLLDTALGLIMAVDRDHEFRSLPVAVAAGAARLDDLDRLRAGGRARIAHIGCARTDLPILRTANLTSAR